MTVNMHEAKSQLSRLVEGVELGGGQVLIARNGRPVARLVGLAAESEAPQRRLGVAKGRFTAPPADEAGFEDLPALFLGPDGP